MRPTFGMRATTIWLSVICGFAASSSAQTSGPPKPRPPSQVAAPNEAPQAPIGLTNADVLQMVAAKLAEDIVLKAIEDAPKKTFDLSPAGLVALKNGGVSDELIRVMQGRPRTSSPAQTPTDAAAAPKPGVHTAAAPEPQPRADNKDDDRKKSRGVSRFLGGGLIGGLKGGKKSEDGTSSVQPKLKDGEAATVRTSMSEPEATARVKAYFNSKNIDFTVNPDTNRVISDWYGERRCGPGFHRCANKANVRVLTEEGRTTLRIQVFERKREGGMNQKPWKEDTNSKGKETAEFAATLETFLSTSSIPK